MKDRRVRAEPEPQQPHLRRAPDAPEDDWPAQAMEDGSGDPSAHRAQRPRNYHGTVQAAMRTSASERSGETLR